MTDVDARRIWDTEDLAWDAEDRACCHYCGDPCGGLCDLIPGDDE